MSVGFQAVQWNRTKLVYDAILIAGAALCIATYLIAVYWFDPPKDLPAAIDIRIRAFGTCAFFMLTIILSIGPLARLDRRFLPLLYNRRHFGVLTFFIALAHAWFMIEWFAAQDALPSLYDEISKISDYGKFIGFPFKMLGLAALVILFLMAATSHDYWLAFLTPPVWKCLHMGALRGLRARCDARRARDYAVRPQSADPGDAGGRLRLRDRAASLSPAGASVPADRFVLAPRAMRAGSRSGRRSRSRTRARASSPRPTASALRCSATARRSARSPIFAPTRMGRSARGGSSTVA